MSVIAALVPSAVMDSTANLKQQIVLEAAHLSVTTTLGQEPGTRAGRLGHAEQSRGKVLIGSFSASRVDRA
jgi:hypothetical protein